MRRLLPLVSAIVLVDTMFYAAITPLLPYYAHRLALSKSAAGLLVAAYPAGTMAGSIPGGWLAARAGSRPTVLAGLGLLAASSLAFGFGRSAAVLDGARFVQGVGGAASWAGGLAWLVAAAPRSRRGEVIGTAFGAAVGGALLGPVLGALARASGPKPLFAGVAGLALVLALVAVRTPAPAARRADGGDLRDPRVRAGGALIVLVGLFFGTLEVLVPLRLDRLGVGGPQIAAVFLGSALLQALASPLFGRWLDRRGPLPLTRLELALGVALGATIPLLGSAAAIALLAALAGVAVGGLWIPGMTLMSRGADARGADQAYAFALVNLLWAAAQVAGAAGGSRAAEAAGDGVPYLAVVTLFLAALAVSFSRSAPGTRPRRSRPVDPG